MSEGDANAWKDEFFEAAEQMTPFTQGTYEDLIKAITKDFSPYNAPKTQFTKWRRWRRQIQDAGDKVEVEEEQHGSRILQRVLTDPTAEEHPLTLAEPPSKLEGWYEWLNNHLRMRSTIMEMMNKGHLTTNLNTNWNLNHKPRRFYFHWEKKDADAMDVDAMSTERDDLMKKGLCFLCKKPRRISWFCPGKSQRQPLLTDSFAHQGVLIRSQSGPSEAIYYIENGSKLHFLISSNIIYILKQLYMNEKKKFVRGPIHTRG